jgi:hypothetical protein
MYDVKSQINFLLNVITTNDPPKPKQAIDPKQSWVDHAINQFPICVWIFTRCDRFGPETTNLPLLLLLLTVSEFLASPTLYLLSCLSCKMRGLN